MLGNPKGYLFLLVLFLTTNVFAGDFYGVVRKYDNGDVTNVYQARVTVKEGTNLLTVLNTFPDGGYKFPLSKNSSYYVKITYAGYADTSFTFTTDKAGKPTAQNVSVMLKKDGIHLFGSVRTVAEFMPIKNVVVVLKNVMTREEKRINTGSDGTYRFRLEYENNYRLSVDKRSDGIFNKYRDTVLYISTINITQPMDYWLDLRLDEDREKKTEGIEGYDPMHANKPYKPGIDVVNKSYKQATPNSMDYREAPKSATTNVPETPKPVVSTPDTIVKQDSTIMARPIPATGIKKEDKPLPGKAVKIDSAEVVVAKVETEKPKPVEQKPVPTNVVKPAPVKEVAKGKTEKAKPVGPTEKELKQARRDSLELAETKAKEEAKKAKELAEARAKEEAKQAKEREKEIKAKPATAKVDKPKGPTEKQLKQARLDSLAMAEAKAKEEAKKTKELAEARAKEEAKLAKEREKELKAKPTTAKVDKPTGPTEKQLKQARLDSLAMAEAKAKEEAKKAKELAEARAKEEAKLAKEREKELKAKPATAKVDKPTGPTEKQLKQARLDSLAMVEAKAKEEAKKAKEKPVVAKPAAKPVEKAKAVAPTEKELKQARKDSLEKAEALAKEEAKKAREAKTKPVKVEPARPAVVTGRTAAEVKADIEKAEKDLELLKKKEVEILKMAAFEKKQQEKNKGIEIVIIGENRKVTPEQVTAQRIAAEQKIKTLEEELAAVKKRKK